MKIDYKAVMYITYCRRMTANKNVWVWQQFVGASYLLLIELDLTALPVSCSKHLGKVNLHTGTSKSIKCICFAGVEYALFTDYINSNEFNQDLSYSNTIASIHVIQLMYAVSYNSFVSKQNPFDLQLYPYN